MNSVFVEDMDWVNYRERTYDGSQRIIIPVGAIEQHGHHLPLNTDVVIPCHLAKALAEETDNLLVAPAINYGYKSQVQSGGGNFFPGTTCVSGSVLENYLYDVMDAYLRHGNRELILLNGHFENAAFLAEAADRLTEAYSQRGVRVRVYLLSYWDFLDEALIPELFPDGFAGWQLEHGGVLETSIMLHIDTARVKMQRAVDSEPASFPPYNVFPPDPDWVPASGTLSSPIAASAEKGALIVDHCVANMVSHFGYFR